MTAESTDPRFEGLLRRLLDDAVPPAAAEIEAAMKGDPERLGEYLEQVELDALLAWELGGEGDTALDFEVAEARASGAAGLPRALPRRRAWLAAAAAAALLAAGYFAGNRAEPPARPEAPAVAVLIEAEDCLWELESGRTPEFGSAFPAGETLRIREGVARLAMRNRAGFALEGPAAVELVTGEVLRLEHGRVSAHAPDEAIGFTILTPGLEIVDLGTRFAASVEADGSTEVHVFDGEVSVQERSGAERGGAPSELVTTGQARRYGADGAERAEIAIDPARFADPPDLEQLLAATGAGPENGRRRDSGGLREPPAAGQAGGALLAFQDFTRGEGELDGRGGGSGFGALPWAASRDFTRLIPSVLSHSGEAGAGGYLLVRGRERSEPFIANRVRRELASALPEEFYFAIRASYHGLDEEDFFSLWIDTHGSEDASHSGAPTLGIREGRFFARLDLDHSAAAGRALDGEIFVLAARHAWIPGEERARIELWIDPRPGALPDAAASGPRRPGGPASYRFLGLRMGKDTEVGDRLLVRGIALGRTLEAALEALGE